jgi:L-seryl-tRNA(Ser) seleniumtransferase
MAAPNPKLRELPSVDELAASLADIDAPRSLLISEVRRVLASMRADLAAGADLDPSTAARLVREAIAELARPSLRRVINASGVVLHTNLGRAPSVHFKPLEGYSNLEYDLARGRRGKRDTHLAALIERLCGKPGIAVNNNAAAVLLVLAEMARGAEVIVSRGELIEIGDGFRIPDIMAASGAILREIGTTNRTHLDDYRAAINDRTRLILRVHPSNFHVAGFTAKPELRDLAALARERGTPLYEDLGSGCIADLAPFGIREPRVAESLTAGVDIVSFSGDKLLGGPQAGIIAGVPELVGRIRRNPLFRALRLDKLITQALETTLRDMVFERWDEIPALRMLRTSPDEIHDRSLEIRAQIPELEVIPGESLAGGGSTPDQSLPTWLLAMPGNPVELERKLRMGNPPVIARIENDRLMLDLRTVFPEEEADLIAALRRLVS